MCIHIQRYTRIHKTHIYAYVHTHAYVNIYIHSYLCKGTRGYLKFQQSKTQDSIETSHKKEISG